MNPLTLTKLSEVEVKLLPEAITQRDAALDRAATITAVNDDAGQTDCVEYLRALKSISKSVEESRTGVKAPVLDLGRRIDTFAKEFVAKVEVETARLTKLLTAYQVEQQRKAQEAERLRQEELKRQEAERLRIEAAERQQREEADRAAEQARIKAEAEFFADDEAEAAKAREVAAEAQRKADEETAKLAQAQRDKAAAETARLTTLSAPAVKVAKPSGMSVAKVWKFEVTDLNALVKAKPYLCRIEANTAAINAEIKLTKEIPGLRIWEEIAANVR